MSRLEIVFGVAPCDYYMGCVKGGVSGTGSCGGPTHVSEARPIRQAQGRLWGTRFGGGSHGFRRGMIRVLPFGEGEVYAGDPIALR
jgi:hypothetical protein